MSSVAFALDHISPLASEKLCYVHCSFCDTVLAVSVPCSSLFRTVTVRCGHCTNLLSVNMRALLLPAGNQFHHGDSFLIPAHTNLLEELSCPQTPLLQEQPAALTNETVAPVKGTQEMMNQIPAVNRRLQYLAAKGISTRGEASLRAAPEKRQRVPSAYNRFIKEEIQRIKASNPDITHREAFSAAAKNWAHFPHIHFGLMPDQGPKSIVRQQEGEDLLLKDGFYAAAAAAANLGVTPF